ncbi:snapalysin family zinc-dependent metalloprotease [Saccharopolyspora halophila]|uniref:Extracellular small neutral protease n=1 Tax=Saccharopolyspora halophila TaxID=405551 RepID=A0ABN3GR94_9PSEU
MPRSSMTALAGAVTALLLVGSAPAASANSATSAGPHIVTYDAGKAAEFQAAVDAAAQVWNGQVSNVTLQKSAGGPADLTVLADDGWPRAQVDSLGSGTVWMGREAVSAGHHVPRIATHEIGHIFGLPDNRTGVCADLMSGASAGTDCTNDLPNEEEKGEVERNFAQDASIAPRLLAETPALATR